MIDCVDMRTQRFIIRNAGDFGRTISEARRLAGYTQAQLAERTGIDRTYLSRLESGLETVHLARALRALRSLGVEINASMTVNDDDVLDVD